MVTAHSASSPSKHRQPHLELVEQGIPNRPAVVEVAAVADQIDAAAARSLLGETLSGDPASERALA
jgi:hypothetical protein